MKKRILTIQDISCVGQCSLTVALPIISAFGIETAVIPTAVLSTHTAFKNFTFCDLTEELPKIEDHWRSLNLKFDGFYTGYVGSVKQIDYIISLFRSCGNGKAVKVVDPCMADNGKLYVGFSDDFPKAMLRLCQEADVILPNLTEACLLLDIPYRKDFTKEELEALVLNLADLTKASVVLTGVSFDSEKLGALTYDFNNAIFDYHFTEFVPAMFHGTGDCFASSFFGAYISDLGLFKASKIACEFTCRAVKATYEDRQKHWYGVHFEEVLGYLTDLLK